jgi:hypothetical protein
MAETGLYLQCKLRFMLHDLKVLFCVATYPSTWCPYELYVVQRTVWQNGKKWNIGVHYQITCRSEHTVRCTLSFFLCNRQKIQFLFIQNWFLEEKSLPFCLQHCKVHWHHWDLFMYSLVTVLCYQLITLTYFINISIITHWIILKLIMTKVISETYMKCTLLNWFLGF